MDSIDGLQGKCTLDSLRMIYNMDMGKSPILQGMVIRMWLFFVRVRLKI